MTKIAIIDNYDSFTYNLVHYFEALDCDVTVFRNDDVDFYELESFSKIVLSPGPGIPDEAGMLKEIIRHFATSKSILGICLGQQAIAEVFGGKLINLKKVHHGIASQITITQPNDALFVGIPKTINVGRYHSWTVSKDKLPDVLIITSLDENGEIMSLQHQTLNIRAVQFHPESILTQHGKQLLKNWLNC